ncbi:GntR family transcriptional regulator, partial [Rhizobium ruizarguesonis]
EMASRRMRAHMLNSATSLSLFIETNKPGGV